MMILFKHPRYLQCRTFFPILIILGVYFLFCGLVGAQEYNNPSAPENLRLVDAGPTLRWDANTETDLAGYFLYYKSDFCCDPYNGYEADQGNSPIKIPLDSPGFNQENPEFSLTGLDANKPYFLVVKSFNADGAESFYSKVVNTRAPQIISYPTVVYISDNAAVIEWTTDQEGNGEIRYSQVTAPWNSGSSTTIVNAWLSANHSLTLTGLNSDTTYYFQAGSTTELGFGPDSYNGQYDNNPSLTNSFRTSSVPDLRPPQIISSPTVIAISDTTATIIWETDEPADSNVEYGLTTSYGLLKINNADVMSHSVTLSNLSPETIYQFRVYSIDIFNNNSMYSKNGSFKTKDTPDTSAPQFVSPPTATAKSNQSITLEWLTDEPSNSLVQYDKQSSEWDSYNYFHFDAENVTHHRVVIAGLEAVTQYYVRAGGSDVFNNGPDTNPDDNNPSNEITVVTKSDPDSTAPRLTVPPTVTGITDTTATIEWETDEPSNSVVKYLAYVSPDSEPSLDWTDASLLVTAQNAMVIKHSVTLTNLSPSTNRYYFMAGSTDVAGNGPDPEAIDSNNPFTQDFFSTKAISDELAPKIISGPTVTGTDNKSAIIEWKTDEPSNSIVKYGEVEAVQSQIGGDTWDNLPLSESDAAIVTQHSVTITNLNSLTTYVFRAGSIDALGNGPDLNQDPTNASVMGTFETALGADEVAPSITNLKVFFVTNTTALITWDTDEPSNSIIQYGVVNREWDNYTFEESDAGMLKHHSITITGLQPSTDYYFRAGSSDAKSNGPWLNSDTQTTNPSNEITFKSAAGPDFTAPKISNFQVTSKTDKTAVIEWITDEPGNSQVRFASESNSWQTYPYAENDAEMVTEHSVTLTGLSPSTLYYLRISSTDASGNNFATSLADQNPSIEYNLSTSDADPPSIIIYPEADYPKIDYSNGTIDITFDEPNMQNARLEANYIFWPSLVFAVPGNSIQKIGSNDKGSTYRLSFVSIPQYTIFSLTVWDEITDADGYSVEPATVLINDNDADNLPDDWEQAVGLDPTSVNTAEGQGRDGDFDNDGASNYDEFINGTDPKDATSTPASPQILRSLPHKGAGSSDFTWVPNNTSFAILIVDSAGGIDIDPNNPESSVTFTISVSDGGELDTYTVDLSDAIKEKPTVRILKLDPDEPDNAVTALWVAYDRSQETLRDAFYPFNADVDINVLIQNNAGQFVDEGFSFSIESQSEHNAVNDPDNLLDVSFLDQDDPNLNDPAFEYDIGIRLNSEELEGAKVIFNSDQPVTPLLMTNAVTLANVDTVGKALFIQPPTIFMPPAKIIIPVRGSEGSANEMEIYMYTGTEWVLACSPSGEVQEDGYGWMVPNSRVNNINGSPPTIEIKAYHTSGIYAASQSKDGNGNGGGDGFGVCFIDTLRY